jgi:protein-tyrosine phosphatase
MSTDISYITDRIYISDQATAGNFELLKQYGIDTVLNVCRKQQTEEKLYDAHNILCLHQPMEDTAEQDLLPEVENAYDYLYSWLAAGRTVLVHCRAGISRSVSTVIYYLMRTHGWTYDQTFTLISDSRAKAKPNSNFEAQLRVYEITRSAIVVDCKVPVSAELIARQLVAIGADKQLLALFI